LGLSSDQKARISELNFGILDKNEAITKDQNMSDEVKKQSIQGNNEARLEILRGILTPEQYELYIKPEMEFQSAKKGSRLDVSKIAPQAVEPATAE
jgi:hypothetical protein